MSRARALTGLLLLFVVLTLLPAPTGVTPQGWRQTAIFITVIAGMVAEPLPASALVLIGLSDRRVLPVAVPINALAVFEARRR